MRNLKEMETPSRRPFEMIYAAEDDYATQDNDATFD